MDLCRVNRSDRPSEPQRQAEWVIDQLDAGQVFASGDPFVGDHGPQRACVDRKMGLEVGPSEARGRHLGQWCHAERGGIAQDGRRGHLDWSLERQAVFGVVGGRP